MKTTFTILALCASCGIAAADIITRWDFNSVPSDGSTATGTLLPAVGAGTATGFNLEIVKGRWHQDSPPFRAHRGGRLGGLLGGFDACHTDAGEDIPTSLMGRHEACRPVVVRPQMGGSQMGLGRSSLHAPKVAVQRHGLCYAA
jgi:hypothetical protein